MNSSPVRKILKLKKRLDIRKKSRDSDRSLTSSAVSVNSFLEEIEHNKDIDWKVRKDIEDKFKKSSVNAQYVFPRVSVGESRNLPKIKLERRNVSHFEATLNVESVIGHGGEVATGRVMRMPNLIKKGANFERTGNSVTPNPYFKEGRKLIATMKRSTPSPAPQWKLALGEKKRFL